MFYVIEGHQAGGGIYVSEDDGASWTKRYSMADVEKRPTSSNPSQPTNIISTNDGLVLASDDSWAGLLGIPRIGPIASRKLALTWRWSTGYGSDVLGFGNQAHRDPDTGIVYVVYRSTFALQPPIITGGTATTGAKVWEWPTASEVTDNNETPHVRSRPVREGARVGHDRHGLEDHHRVPHEAGAGGDGRPGQRTVGVCRHGHGFRDWPWRVDG